MAKNSDSITVPHPKFGHVVFNNPTLREREVLEHYLKKNTRKRKVTKISEPWFIDQPATFKDI